MWPGRPMYLALDLAEPVMALSSAFVVVAVEYEPPAMQPEPRLPLSLRPSPHPGPVLAEVRQPICSPHHPRV